MVDQLGQLLRRGEQHHRHDLSDADADKLGIRIMIAAPAVHVDKWKHWSFAEGRQNCVRFLPEGCMLTLENGNTQYRERSTGRIFNLTPFTPDQAAWRQANWDKLEALSASKRRRAADKQRVVQGKCSIDRNSPDLQLVGNQGGDRYLASTFNNLGFSYLQAFWGISNLQETPNGQFSTWPGLTTGSGVGGHFWLLQPVIRHDPGGTSEKPPGWTPINSYYIYDEAYDGINHMDYQSLNLPIIEGIGFWGIARWYPGREWLVQCFRGNKGNTGPAFGRPFTAGLPLYDPTGRTFGPFTLAQCAIELQTPEPACSDISATAVFGGVEAVHSGRNQGAVDWVGSWNGAGPPVCNCGSSIPNPTANPATISIYFLDH
jgi:hypothetical protein